MLNKTKIYWIVGVSFSILTIISAILINNRIKRKKNLDGEKFRKKLIDLANSEWSKWNKDGKVIKEGSKDTLQDLRNYWEQGAGVKENDNYYINKPWSASFISYLMRKSGAGDDFNYNQSHSFYIVDAVKNRKQNNSKKFKAYKPEEVDVKVGDLVCYPRQSGITYDSPAPYFSHCDLITQINGNVAVGIGGNVSNSVSKKNYYLANNKIDKSKSEKVFVVIKNLK